MSKKSSVINNEKTTKNLRLEIKGFGETMSQKVKNLMSKKRHQTA